MIIIRLKTDSSAFQNRLSYGDVEVARILREIADNLEQGIIKNSMLDINGNSVCNISYTGKDRR